MAEDRQQIPESTQREVRKRCSFGCVICGFPLYEYHHMTPWSECLKHEPDNLTLLCPTHHAQAGKLLPDEKIREADANPHNRHAGVSRPFNDLYFEGDSCKMLVGGNGFVRKREAGPNSTVAIAVSIDDFDLLSFRLEADGGLFLSACVFDECNLPILIIADNWLQYSVGVWDVQFKGGTLTLREAAGKIFFEIEFVPPNTIVVPRARLLCNGVEILVRREHIFVVNTESVIKNCYMEGIIALQLGRNSRGLPVCVGSDPQKLTRNYLPAAESGRKEKERLEQMKMFLELVSSPRA